MKKIRTFLSFVLFFSILSFAAFAQETQGTQTITYNDGEFSFDLPLEFYKYSEDDHNIIYLDKLSNIEILFFQTIIAGHTLEREISSSVFGGESEHEECIVRTINNTTFVEYTFSDSGSIVEKRGCWINDDNGAVFALMYIVISGEYSDVDDEIWENIVNTVKYPDIQEESTTGASSSESEESSSHKNKSDSEEIMLKKGDKGNDVKQLQEMLIALGFLNDTADGSFGSKTETAVKAYQKDNKLFENGIVTKGLLDSLQSEYMSNKGSKADTNKVTENDYDLAYVIRGKNYWSYWVINTETKVIRSFTTEDYGVLVGTYKGDLINGADVTYKGGVTEHICYKWVMTDSKLMIDGYYEASKTSVSSAIEYLNNPEYQDITE